MLHLFNRIYVEHEQFIEGGDMIHLSKLFNLKPKELPPSILLLGVNLQDAYPEKNYLDLFKLLSKENRKIVIYTDTENFSEVVATWLKSLTNMNTEAYTKFIDMYLHKYNTYYGLNKEPLRTHLLNAWNTAVSYDLSEVSKSVSYEFLLSSALYNKDFQYKDILKNLLLSFTKREYEYTLLELKKNLDNFMFSDSVLKIFGEDIDTVEEMQESSKYKQIFNIPMWKSEVSYDYVGINYLPGSKSIIDLSLATPQDIDNLFEVYTQVTSKILETKAPLPVDIVTSNFYEQDVKEICAAITNKNMSEELYEKCLSRIVENDFLINTPTDLIQTTLNIFISYIKKLKLNNDMDRLYYFTIK